MKQRILILTPITCFALGIIALYIVLRQPHLDPFHEPPIYPNAQHVTIKDTRSKDGRYMIIFDTDDKHPQVLAYYERTMRERGLQFIVLRPNGLVMDYYEKRGNGLRRDVYFHVIVSAPGGRTQATVVYEMYPCPCETVP